MYLDIKKIKKEITMAHVLSYYGIQLRRMDQQQLTGCCPIHHGDNPTAFHVNLKLNLFNCFTRCGGGSIFDFVMKKEKTSFYQAALKIWKIFYHPTSPSGTQTQKTIRTLKLNLLPDHPYLRKRNISAKLARDFQLGFCRYGIMKNRIAIPIRDEKNNILAYCGRAIEDYQSPKYLFPKHFKKSHHLFNIHRIAPNGRKPVFVVEGFFDCIHIVKHGFDAIALMGGTISQIQLKTMKELNRFYILIMDGDEAGRKATPKIEASMKAYNITFKTVYLIDVKEPELLDDLDLKLFSQIRKNET